MNKKREAYEEGLQFFIKEYVQLYKHKGPEDYRIQLAHNKWLRMDNQIKSGYQKKAIEEQQQNTEQKKEQQKQQVEVTQQFEAQIEEGQQLFIKEYVQLYKNKGPEDYLIQLAQNKWLRMDKQIKTVYQKKAIEEQEQNIEQKKEQQKQQEDVTQQFEAQIEEGQQLFIKEYIQLYKNKGPEDYRIQLAQNKWLRMHKQIKTVYQKKAIEEQEQNIEQKKEQQKQQVKVQQQIEAPIDKRKKEKINVTASPQPNKGRQKEKAQSVDKEEQVVQQKRDRPFKQNGEHEAKTIAGTAKTKQLNDMQVQEQKDKEEQAQFKQHISSMANSKVGYQHGNHKEIIDTLLLHMKYDLEFVIKYYENKIMEDKNQIKKNKT